MRPRRSPPAGTAAPVARAEPTTTRPIRCPHFGPCGGCDLLDRFYREEVAQKRRRLEELLLASRLGGFELLPFVRARRPLFYRRSIKIPFARTSGRVVAGVFRRGSHGIVNLEECAVQDPFLTRLLRSCRSQAARFEVPIYAEHRHRGLLRWLVARRCPESGETLLGLVVRRSGAPQVRRLARELFARFASEGLVGVVENENPEVTNAVFGPRTKRLEGRPRLRVAVGEDFVELSLPTFLQVHAEQAERLARHVLREIRPDEGMRVLDLFAGFGPLALRCARAGASVRAVETSPSAVADGARAARALGLEERLVFERGDAAAAARRLADDGGEVSVVLADPPRRGLGTELVDALQRLRARTLLYVSCEPESFVRDAEALAPRWKLETLRPIDLFPRTRHLELVARFARR